MNQLTMKGNEIMKNTEKNYAIPIGDLKINPAMPHNKQAILKGYETARGFVLTIVTYNGSKAPFARNVEELLFESREQLFEAMSQFESDMAKVTA